MSNLPFCLVCGCGANRRELARVGKWTISACANCQGESVDQAPTGSELQKAYSNFDAGQIARRYFDDYARMAQGVLRNELTRASWSETQWHGARFLDYGCGGGHFLRAAAALGMQPTGVELDDVSVAAARERGLAVVHGVLPDARSQLADGYDVVFSMHVIEHVPQPWAVLQSLRSLLRPGGVMLIGVPDQSSYPSAVKKLLLQSGLRGGHYGFITPPIHLHGYVPRTVKIWAERLDLRVVAVRRTSPLDPGAFPTTPGYWTGLGAQRWVYRAARLLGKPGHISAVLVAS